MLLVEEMVVIGVVVGIVLPGAAAGGGSGSGSRRSVTLQALVAVSMFAFPSLW